MYKVGNIALKVEGANTVSELLDIKTIALNLDVSRQTVYNHVEKNSQALKGNIRKVQGVTYLNQEGIYIIKESMGLIKTPVQKESIGIEEIIKEISENIQSGMQESIEELRENLKEDIKEDYQNLQEQIELLKKQNENLILILEKQEQERLQKQEKKSIFDIFKRK